MHGAYRRRQVFARASWIAAFEAGAPTGGVAFLASQIVSAVWVGQRALLAEPDAGQLRMRHGNADVGLNHRTQILVGAVGQRGQLLECGVDDVVEEDAQDLVFAREVPVNGSSGDTGALSYGVDASGVKALLVEQILSSLKNML